MTEPSADPAPPARRSWLARNRVVVIATAILAVYLARNVVESRRSAADRAARPGAPNSATVSGSLAPADVSASFVPRSPAPGVLPVSTPLTFGSGSSGSSASATAEPKHEAIDFVMPNFVGSSLQAAQNGVQKHGLFFSRSRDLLGSRRQLLDRNWRVCSQTPAAGERVHGSRLTLEGTIEFGVVKTTERCP